MSKTLTSQQIEPAPASRSRLQSKRKMVIAKKPNDDEAQHSQAPSAKTRIEFVGTGNSKGIPALDCECDVCREAAFNLERRRNSPCTIFSCNGETIVIDAGYSDLPRCVPQYQLTGLLLSHFHRGHTAGLRNLAAAEPKRLKVLCPPDESALPSLQQIEQRLEFQVVHPGTWYELGAAKVMPILLNHGSITYGYAIELGGIRLGYLCDTCGLPPKSEEWLAAWQPHSLLIDCNDPPGIAGSKHNNPEHAFAIHERTGARRSYLMHLSCAADRWLYYHPQEIPKGISVAHDGMVLETDSFK